MRLPSVSSFCSESADGALRQLPDGDAMRFPYRDFLEDRCSR